MDASPPSSGVARRLECRHRCFRDTQQRLPSGTILCLEGNALNDGGEVGLAALVELFAEDIDWDIPGDLTVVPWIGPRRNREAVRAFYHELAARLAPERFEVQSILADDEQAVALGELASRIKATGRLIETPFAFVLTVRDGKIVRYRMLDDSHGVAVEASGQSA